MEVRKTIRIDKDLYDFVSLKAHMERRKVGDVLYEAVKKTYITKKTIWERIKNKIWR